MNIRDHLSPEDRAILDEAAREAAENRKHNVAEMDKAGVPRAARRGFTTATSYHAYRIVSIEERPRFERGSRWIVTCEMYPGAGAWGRTASIIGPRGKTTKAH